jgi:hypothetical protein
LTRRHVTEVFDELGLERLLASTPTDDLAESVQHAIGPHDLTTAVSAVLGVGQPPMRKLVTFRAVRSCSAAMMAT